MLESIENLDTCPLTDLNQSNIFVIDRDEEILCYAPALCDDDIGDASEDTIQISENRQGSQAQRLT